MWMAEAPATVDLDILKCFSLNKNCLLKLDTSMMSGSVRVMLPF
jgi:hypothetical protein